MTDLGNADLAPAERAALLAWHAARRRDLVLRGVEQAWDGKTPELAAAALTTWLDGETLDRVETVLSALLDALRSERKCLTCDYPGGEPEPVRCPDCGH